jgi:hypothetical protein
METTFKKGKKVNLHVWIYPDMKAKLLEYSKKYKLNLTETTIMAMRLGLQAIDYALNPDMAKFFEKQMQEMEKNQ